MKALAGILAMAMAVSGCAHVDRWPEPKRTTEMIMDPARRTVLASVVLGDALRVVLPPPREAGTRWMVFVVNPRALRQMGPMHPAAERPGCSEVSFQAIHIVGRTRLELAAAPPKAQGFELVDTFTLGVNVKHEGE